MKLSASDAKKIERFEIRLTRPEDVDRVPVRRRERRNGQAHPGKDNDGFIKAFDAAGQQVGQAGFVQLEDGTVETTDIHASLEGEGVALALIVELIRLYEGSSVRESVGINTKDGNGFLAAIRRKGIEYHEPRCQLDPSCSCFVRA